MQNPKKKKNKITKIFDINCKTALNVSVLAPFQGVETPIRQFIPATKGKAIRKTTTTTKSLVELQIKCIITTYLSQVCNQQTATKGKIEDEWIRFPKQIVLGSSIALCICMYMKKKTTSNHKQNKIQVTNNKNILNK